MNDQALRLRTLCAHHGLPLDDGQLSRLTKFAELLLAWNKQVNLISRKDEESLWSYHLPHSLSVLMKLEIPVGAAVLDLGTGGGLPGIPLAVVRPDIRFTLLDSTKKKIDAVSDMSTRLELSNVRPIWGRAEEVARSADFHQRFDIVMARAVASLKDLVKWSQPFLKAAANRDSPAASSRKRLIVTSGLITLKGGDLESEMRQVAHVKSIRKVTTITIDIAESEAFLDSDKKILVVEF